MAEPKRGQEKAIRRWRQAPGAGGQVAMPFTGSSFGGSSVSPRRCLISISMLRQMVEMGTSLALPSKGLAVLSVTWSRER